LSLVTSVVLFHSSLGTSLTVNSL